jgi:alpha-1,2-mannosyltransferase
VTTVGRPVDGGRPFASSTGHGLRRLTGWGPALVSLTAALAYGLYVALRTYEVDLGVYLRLGGRYIFTPHLYSLGLPNTSLLFTYPHFAALLFAPWQRVFTTVDSVQVAWTMCNLATLIGLLVLSIRVLKPELGRTAAMRLGLLLSLPALLLNPVVITVGFGQVNLVVTLLVMWDLLSERRIGSWQAPLGVATGLAAAVKLTPILFVPYLILTRRTRGAVTCVVTFVVCELVTFLVSPTSSTAYWTKTLFKPGRAGKLSFVGDQNLMAAVERLHHGLVTNLALLPVLVAVAAGGLWLAALAHRRSSPMLGLLVCAATGLLVSPISWVHHMVWVVPAILWLGLAKDRPRFGVPLAIGTAVLFWIAPIWWVPYVGTSDLHLNAWQLVAGNSFLFAVLLFLLGAAVLLARRRSVSCCLAEADLPRVR